MKTATFTALSLLVLLATASAQDATASKRPGLDPKTSPMTPPPLGTSASASNTSDYRLAAGDKLRIEVYKDQQLSQSLQIRPDGKITLPLLGDVPAAGRTSLELRDAIGAGLKEYIANPVVTVIVVETAPQVVYVTGEVNKPGALPLATGHISVIQAIAMAGGFTDFAHRSDIRILRKGASGMQTLRFNYKEALDDENRSEPPQLQPGDTVIVR
jgi:polysaccharide export outer membrane protein